MLATRKIATTHALLELYQLPVWIYMQQTLKHRGLTYWDRNKMSAIFQTTFWNAFSWMKMYEFRLRFLWSLFLRVQSTISQPLVQIMAWCRSGDKPLSESMMVSLLAHICVTRAQWVKQNPTVLHTIFLRFYEWNSYTMYFSLFKFYWSLYLTVKITYSQQHCWQWLGAELATIHCQITWTNDDPVHRRIHEH